MINAITGKDNFKFDGTNHHYTAIVSVDEFSDLEGAGLTLPGMAPNDKLLPGSRAVDYAMGVMTLTSDFIWTDGTTEIEAIAEG